MSYTFLDQQNKLSSLLGDPNTSEDDQWTLAVRKKELNRGELHFARDSKILTEYATGTIASKELDVPSDWIETYKLIIDDVMITNDREISLSEWERYYNWGGTKPFYYFWEFSGVKKMKFLASTAVNGATYLLYYFKKPTTELDADSDVSLFPEEYREASVYYCASQLLDQIGNTLLADRYRAVYNSFVDNATLDFEKKYVNRETPVPDFGDNESTDVDRQGVNNV